MRSKGCLLFDWGNTLMREIPGETGPMSQWAQVEAMPGALETLTVLRRDWWLALATNAKDSDESQIWAALARVGLAELIDAVYCFRRIGHKKPTAAFFGYILADLGTGPERVAMIGDDFESDVLGANASGIQAVWFDEGAGQRREGPLFRTVHRLAELPEVLPEWFGAPGRKG